MIPKGETVTARLDVLAGYLSRSTGRREDTVRAALAAVLAKEARRLCVVPAKPPLRERR